MILDVDYLINFFEKHSGITMKDEMEEQEDSGSAPTGGGGGGKIPKWADSYPLTRGKANRLGVSGEKWDTGIKRGSANQIW